MSQYKIFFHEDGDRAAIAQIDSDTYLSELIAGNTIRFHTTEPSDTYIIGNVHHELTINKDKSITQHEVRM